MNPFFYWDIILNDANHFAQNGLYSSFILLFTFSPYPFLSFFISISLSFGAMRFSSRPPFLSFHLRLTYKSVSGDRRRGRYSRRIAPEVDRASPLPLPYRTFRQIHYLVPRIISP